MDLREHGEECARMLALSKSACAAVAAMVLSVATILVPGASAAQDTIKGERYVPSIWVDPDGCEHWVLDDGAEGYMSPHLTRDGRPVCRRGKVCGIMPTDQYFATNQSAISAERWLEAREAASV